MFLALLPTLLRALPALLRLFQSVSDYATLQQGRGMGKLEAVNEALTHAADEVDAATKARAEAEADHAAHPNDDDGFDPHFRRND